MDAEGFWTICSLNGVVLSPEQMRDFQRYHDELVYWNAKVNLISRKDEENIWERHFLHSLSLLINFSIPPKSNVLDVGTGGGFPGLPVKIVRPDIHLLMVDSISKKVKLTSMFAQHTGLRYLEVACLRAEDIQSKYKEKRSFDFIVSRAVAQIDKIIDWTMGVSVPGTKWLMLKGGDLTTEVELARTRYPGICVELTEIRISGAPWFEAEDKKIVVCSRS